MAVRKKPRAPRTLWFHPESESYVECFTESEAHLCADEGCLEVSGMREHEANYFDQQRAKMDRLVDEVSEMIAERAISHARSAFDRLKRKQ